jgi:alpha-L-fucosidase
VGEAAAAIRERGLRFGTYYCGGTDGTFGRIPMVDLASHLDALPPTEQYREYATAHWRELVERYEPSVLWNDFCFPGSREALRELLAWYVERVPDGVINNRFQERSNTHMQPCPVYSDFVTPEYSTEGSPALKWEACRSVGLSFGYNALESERTYMSAEELIHLFVDVVSRGGNLLLNISPTATGEVPWGEAERLLALGWWLRENGESIYGTRPWERHAGITLDGQGVRYTSTPDAVHAIVLGTPPAATVDLDVLLEPHAEVRLPGRSAALAWQPTPAGVRIELPEAPPPGPAMSLTLAPREAVRPA